MTTTNRLLSLPQKDGAGDRSNLEEPGMEYMTHWVHEALGTDEIDVTFVPMGDTYQYVGA